MNLICFSHLRWNFVYQRPQHLLSRFSKNYTVYYVEECEYNHNQDGYRSDPNEDNVMVIVPHLNDAFHTLSEAVRLQKIISDFIKDNQIENYIFWYYTPMALKFTLEFNPEYIIYDCMDELSAFKFAPQELKKLENQLIEKADIIFTGGNSLYEAKKNLHKNIFSFPSSIDKSHFAKARTIVTEIEDQKNIPHPRLGFYGVIDERFDIDLIEQAANLHPEWQFILIGPVVKIDVASLPKNKNIHYLGSKKYSELPGYLSGWDVALIPFAINESTKFISPTKTPEYLAAGKPVVSSAITDVVSPYGDKNLVHIFNSVPEFITKVSLILNFKETKKWKNSVDEFLLTISWDITCSKMNRMIKNGMSKKIVTITKSKQHVRLSDSRSGVSRFGVSRETSNPS